MYFFLCLLSVCLFFVNVSCGLDVLSIVLEESDNVTRSDIPTVDSGMDSTFKFSTHTVTDPYSFGRTYIYYKIYNSSSLLESEVNSLTNQAADSSKKYNSANTMMSSTYEYKPLQIKTQNGDKENSSGLELENAAHEIKIRLTTYGDATEEYTAGIWIDGEKKGEPVRVVNSNPFDFGRSSEYVPLSGQEDTKNFTENKDETASDYNVFYVALFAYFMLLDDNYTPIYSPIAHLGSVKIDATTDLN